MIRDTSIAALESMKLVAPSLRERIAKRYDSLSDIGATCEEIEKWFCGSHQTISSAMRTLQKRGVIVDSGKRRPTSSGRMAIVWVRAPEGYEPPPPECCQACGQELKNARA